ncbi:MAG: hypothetical protein JWP59_3376 [Massilia sp.]|nr:hypothetical protein [Massilia sp.]
MPAHLFRPFRVAAPAAVSTLLAACSPGSTVQAGPEAPLAPPTAYHLYVATNGADNNLGSESSPFLSIERASRVALPGTTIHVAPGSYAGGILTTVSGTARNRIYYIATRPGHARIVPPPQSASASAWDNRGDYVDIVGFDIDGSVHQNGVRWRNGLYSAGSFDSLRHNIVHHIARGQSCGASDGADGAGITIESYFKGVHGEVIGNKLYDIGAADCPAVQGIAINTSALVANNLVFRAGHAGIFLWHDAHHVRVLNNTVAASNAGIVVGGGNAYLAAGANDFTNVSNNIVFDNNSGIVERGATGRNNVYHNNLVFNNQAGDWDLAAGMRHIKSVAADPGFIAYNRDAMPDLRLAANSAAIGKGDLAYAHPVDFNGVKRSADGGVDVGALQHR